MPNHPGYFTLPSRADALRHGASLVERELWDLRDHMVRQGKLPAPDAVNGERGVLQGADLAAKAATLRLLAREEG